jgi:circadian clock protein KaiC
VIVVQGVTGSGKTLLGMEFSYRGIVEFDEPGLMIVFEANPGKLIRDAGAFGWNLEELQRQGKLQIIVTWDGRFVASRTHLPLSAAWPGGS